MRMVHRGAICLSILVGLRTSLKERGKKKRRIREKEKRKGEKVVGLGTSLK